MALNPGVPAGNRHRLLVVDDEDSILLPMTRYFYERGLEVVAAREPEEAEALIEHQPFDCVILDLALTRFGREGLEVLSAIRSERPTLPVIILSAFASSDVEEEALRLGADAVLKKPQSLPILAERVFRAMGVST